MFITTKGRYALRVLLYLADRYGIETVPLKKIAKDEEISLKYLEHIMSALVQQDLVKSTKGSKGGYSLTQPPSHYSLGQILRALENDLYLVPCLDEKLNPCKRVDRCATVEVWKLIQDTIDELFHLKVNETANGGRRHPRSALPRFLCCPGLMLRYSVISRGLSCVYPLYR